MGKVKLDTSDIKDAEQREVDFSSCMLLSSGIVLVHSQKLLIVMWYFFAALSSFCIRSAANVKHRSQ